MFLYYLFFCSASASAQHLCVLCFFDYFPITKLFTFCKFSFHLVSLSNLSKIKIEQKAERFAFQLVNYSDLSAQYFLCFNYPTSRASYILSHCPPPPKRKATASLTVALFFYSLFHDNTITYMNVILWATFTLSQNAF